MYAKKNLIVRTAASDSYILYGQVSTTCILAAVSTPIPEQTSTAVSIRGGLDASASILSGQVSTAATHIPDQNSGQTYTVSMDSTFILGQNSTAVPIRSGLGASASTACILSEQVSTAAVSTFSPCFFLFLFFSGQVSTAACILAVAS